MSGSEDRLVSWLRGRPETAGLLGDDGAILPSTGPLVVTTDSQRQGVHFLSRTPVRIVARRLLRVNLSDLAAMGARPRFAFLAVAVPTEELGRRFLTALLQECRRFGVTLAGGDTSFGNKLDAVLTLIGELDSEHLALRRDAARAGDVLWLAGELGLSALGRHLLGAGAQFDGRRFELPTDLPPALVREARRAIRAHLLPNPQLEVGSWLGRHASRRVAMDVSDGFSLDLSRLCEASQIGCEVEARSLRPSPTFNALAEWVGVQADELILGGGEDYALLFALPSGHTTPLQGQVRSIGRLKATPGLKLVNESGESTTLAATGWDHLSAK